MSDQPKHPPIPTVAQAEADVKDKIALLMNKQGWQWHQVEAIIKAALAAEQEKVAWCMPHLPDAPIKFCPACEIVHLADALEFVLKYDGQRIGSVTSGVCKDALAKVGVGK